MFPRTHACHSSHNDFLSAGNCLECIQGVGGGGGLVPGGGGVIDTQ